MMEEIEEHRASKHKGASKDPVNQLAETVPKQGGVSDEEYKEVGRDKDSEVHDMSRDEAIELGKLESNIKLTRNLECIGQIK